MLSRNNKILIGCLALLLAMSVGYALFSDTITVNGSATAKGEFSLTTTCDIGDDVINEILGPNGPAVTGKVTDATITCNDNVINASSTLGAPGSQKWFMVKITNTGTIPAKLKEVVELNNPEYMFANKEVGGAAEGWVGNEQGISPNTAKIELFQDYNYVDDYETETYYGNVFMWEEQQFDAVLDPGESTYFYVLMEWYSAATTPGDPLIVQGNFELTWEQVTE